jgi:uncharacterized membrane protein
VISDIFSRADLAIFPIISILLFISAFICMLIWVNRKGSKVFYEKMSYLPLGGERGDGPSLEKQT